MNGRTPTIAPPPTRTAKPPSRAPGVTATLLRHFIAQFFTGGGVGQIAPWPKVAAGALSTVIPACLLLFPVLSKRYTCALGVPIQGCPPVDNPAALHAALLQADRQWLIALAMAFTVMTAALHWHLLLPGRRDLESLASLPIRVRHIFAAKAAAATLMWAVFAVTLCAAPAFALAVVSSPGQGSVLIPGFATFAAMCAASAFAFLGTMTLQGIVPLLLPARWHDNATVVTQTALFTLSVAAVPLLWRQPYSAWWPPSWFLDLLDSFLGAPAGSTVRAWGALAAALSAAFLTGLLLCRNSRSLLAGPRQGSSRPASLVFDKLGDFFVRDPRELAAFAFIWQTLTRSYVHRLALEVCVGLALAAATRGALDGAERRGAGASELPAVWIPLALSVVATLGLRRLFATPVDWAANWIFRITDGEGRACWFRAADRFIVWCAMVPVYAAATPWTLSVFGFWPGLRALAAGLLTSLLLFESASRNVRLAPFTCASTPGKRPLWCALLLALAASWLLGAAGATVVVLARSAVLFFALLVPAARLWISLRKRRRRAQDEAAITYEEVADPAIHGLHLGFSAAPATVPRRGSSPAASFVPLRGPGANSVEAACGRIRDLTSIFDPRTAAADLREAVRLIRSSPRVSAAAAATLAVGIGVIVTAFTVFNAVALRARVTDPATFFQVFAGRENLGNSGGVSAAEFEAYRQSAAASALSVWAPRTIIVGKDRSDPDGALLVSCDFFSVYPLRRPLLGRVLQPADCGASGSEPPAVISDKLWRERFTSNPRVVGTTVLLNDQPFRVVGVTPPGFEGQLGPANAWVPFTAQPYLDSRDLLHSSAAWLTLEGRLAPGQSRTAAARQLQAIARLLDASRPGPTTTLTLGDGSWMSMAVHTRQDLKRIGWLVGVGAGSLALLLLVTCGSVTVLLLSRAVSRRGVIAIRLALGAPPARILRMLLLESLLLATAAASLGWLIAGIAPIPLYRHLVNAAPPFPLSPDWSVLACCLVTVIVATCVTGLAPAFETLKVDLASVLRAHAPGASALSRPLSAFVGAQIAFSVILLVLAALFGQTQRRMTGADPGFDTTRALAFRLRLSPGEENRAGERLRQRVAAAVASLPEVESVAESPDLVMRGTEAPVRLGAGQFEPVPIVPVTPRFFRTLGIPLLAGREFEESDDSGLQAVVSESFVRRHSLAASPLTASLSQPDGRSLAIIGVVRDVQPLGDDRPRVFLWQPRTALETFFLVRTAPGARNAAAAVQAGVRQVDAGLSVSPRPLQAWLDDSMSGMSRALQLILSIGLLSAGFAVAGAYGAAAFAMKEAKRSMAIRLALGARRADLLAAALLANADPIAGGIYAGVLISIGLTALAAQAFIRLPVSGVAGGPWVYAAAALAVATAAITAILAAAWSAIRKDIVSNLRK